VKRKEMHRKGVENKKVSAKGRKGLHGRVDRWIGG